MSRNGIDRVTMRPLSGWEHCAQSIAVILTTRVGSRIMRRTFGSDVKDLQDRNPDRRTLMQMYMAIATALRLWEPGFRLRRIALVKAAADGSYVFDISGVFFPRGHLGDYAQRMDASASLSKDLNGFRVVRSS